MRKFLSKIGRFFKKRWAILTTAVVALIVGTAGGYTLGHANNNTNNKLPDFANTQNFDNSQNQGQFPGQNGQMPAPPNGSPDVQGGASSESGDSNSNNNSNDATTPETGTQSGSSL
ncbi:MAG: hypothetical protein LBV19_02245 [Streptococcaceae bacterium]|jgi:predicted PurR-regulated permease PerM|nr:hypothetical protein [Streptococcaceae bacterium]